MSRLPQIGDQIANVPTTTEDNWAVVLIEPNSSHSAKHRYLTRSTNLFEQNNIDFITFEEDCNDTCLFIIDPLKIVRAVLYDSENNSINSSQIVSIINSLKPSLRPQINSLENSPPGFNPECPTLKPIVGEYVLGNPQNVDPLLLDFAIYAFALIQPNGTFQVYSERYLKELANLRTTNPKLKVIMAIGGWGNDGFSDAALTPTSRYAFAREAQRWVNRFNLDGVDLDWEYPGSSAAGIKSRPQDGENFTLLIQALRDVLGPEAWISVAGIADNSYVRTVQIDEIAPLITHFNLMSYDFTAGESGANGSKHQSNLFDSDLALNNISVELYINNLLDAGMPPEKILVGIPFYGRRGATFTRTFDEIRKNYLNKNGYKVLWDNVAKAPYIVDPSGKFFLSFDNALSIYYKGQYIYDNCLGGMFSWQSSFDQANILASYMNTAIDNPAELEDILSESYYGPNS
ncbi:MAG: glycosyl hydrolase family 18 protein [Cellulosilyticaceae bacterium]